MSGLLILISGLSGAGKSTLINSAVRGITNLSYLQTVTTRPQRNDEKDSYEYIFVDNNTYNHLKDNSQQWDHTSYNGYAYGANVALTKERLHQGINIICSVIPDWSTVEIMSRLYKADTKTIWIDTPREIAQRRISDDLIRADRLESSEAKSYFDHVFTPKGNMSSDCSAFTAMLSGLIEKGNADSHI